MRHARVSASLLMAAAILPAASAVVMSAAAAWADPAYQPAQQGMAAVPVEVGASNEAGAVLPVSNAQPLPTMSFADREISIPTVTAAAYASGNAVGGLNAVSFQGSGPVSLVESVLVKSLSGQTPTLTVYLFDSQPQHSTFTDQGTFSLNTSTAGTDGIIDIDRLFMAPFQVTLGAPAGTTVSFAENTNLARIPHSGATTLYYALVSGSAFTPGSTSDIRVGLQVVEQHQ